MNNIYVFDLDGTLVNSMPFFAKGILSIADEESIVADRDELLKILTPLGYTKSAEYYVNILGVNESVASLVSKIESRLIYEYENNISTKPFVKEYIQGLANSGERLFVLTASPHSVTDICLKHNGIYDLFEKVWSVEDFGSSKSDTAIFYAVAKHIGCEPCEVNYFDDSLIALKNARAAGFNTYGVYDAQTDGELQIMRNGLANRVIMSFEELI